MSDSIPAITDQWLDRLVDDELTTDERRCLLTALDDEPGGWRRTALAFVEAQAWQGSLGEIVQCENKGNSKPTLDVVSPTAENSVKAECDGITVWRPLALAAGLFFAFALGMIWRGGFDQSNHPNGPGVVVQSPGDLSTGPREPIIVQQIEPPLPDRIARTDPPSNTPPNDALMLLVGGNGSPSRHVPVPLVEASDIDQQIPSSYASAVPDSFRRQLERSGYQVDTRQRYAPIPLQGGRRMYVPVEDTRIVPINLTVY